MSGKTYVKDGKKYELRGECQRCGSCCTARLFYNINEGIVKNITLSCSGGTCKDYENKKCGVYAMRPYICSEFPFVPKELELCQCPGYVFEFVGETDEDDTIFEVVTAMGYVRRNSEQGIDKMIEEQLARFRHERKSGIKKN